MKGQQFNHVINDAQTNDPLMNENDQNNEESSEFYTSEKNMRTSIDWEGPLFSPMRTEYRSPPTVSPNIRHMQCIDSHELARFVINKSLRGNDKYITPLVSTMEGPSYSNGNRIPKQLSNKFRGQTTGVFQLMSVYQKHPDHTTDISDGELELGDNKYSFAKHDFYESSCFAISKIDSVDEELLVVCAGHSVVGYNATDISFNPQKFVACYVRNSHGEKGQYHYHECEVSYQGDFQIFSPDLEIILTKNYTEDWAVLRMTQNAKTNWIQDGFNNHSFYCPEQYSIALKRVTNWYSDMLGKKHSKDKLTIESLLRVYKLQPIYNCYTIGYAGTITQEGVNKECMIISADSSSYVKLTVDLVAKLLCVGYCAVSFGATLPGPDSSIAEHTSCTLPGNSGSMFSMGLAFYSQDVTELFGGDEMKYFHGVHTGSNYERFVNRAITTDSPSFKNALASCYLVLREYLDANSKKLWKSYLNITID
jgi:hypothetical protein